jgi:hypothetical protein
LLRAVVIFVAASPVGAWAQDANGRTVEQYSCKDVMREHGNNRDVTIAFLHGYLLGKSGRSTFNIEDLLARSSNIVSIIPASVLSMRWQR